MKISVLTSSRADFGIQLPLLKALRDDRHFELSIIAFGSHNDPRFGSTVQEITASGFTPMRTLPPTLERDDACGIAQATARTMEQFSTVWRDHPTDMIVALGDRYEMFAAVAAALPFGIPVTHLHGGETTMGAIDNALRHSITHMAAVHCCGAGPYAARVRQLIGHDHQVHNTGALSIDNLRGMELLSLSDLRARFGFDLSRPTVLITVHPETSGTHHETHQWNELTKALDALRADHQLLVTLPNADTHGLRLRERWKAYIAAHPEVIGVDSLGALGYLSCMAHCTFMLGNTSSGYVEASFFPKHVIDLGERQTGRIVTPNIHRCSFDAQAILAAVARIGSAGPPPASGIYGDGRAAERIVAAIKNSAR